MKRFVMLALCFAFAAPVALAGGKHCEHATQDCLNYMTSNMTQKGWLGVEYAEADLGYEIVKIEADSPAQRAGLKVGDVVLAFEGVQYATAKDEDWKSVKGAMVPGNTVTLDIQRKGKDKKVEATLAEMPETIVARAVGQHMMQHAEKPAMVASK